MYSKELNPEQVVLEKLKVAIFRQISQSELRDFEIDFSVDHFSDEILLRFTSFVCAEDKSIQEKYVAYPANWKEALKEAIDIKFDNRRDLDWLRRLLWWRFIKNHPVKYTKITLKAKCLYPDFAPNIPDQKFEIAVFKE